MNTTIGKGITIKGSIQAEEAVTIAGIVKGDVIATNFDVVVESGAQVDGEVTARAITVRGNSKGRLIAREIVRVFRSAAVRADVAAPRLALEEGAMFNGSVAPARVDAAIIVGAYRRKTEPEAVTTIA
jgi:cytoskeletal protein CcmA (bactofilin family)